MSESTQRNITKVIIDYGSSVAEVEPYFARFLDHRHGQSNDILTIKIFSNRESVLKAIKWASLHRKDPFYDQKDDDYIFRTTPLTKEDRDFFDSFEVNNNQSQLFQLIETAYQLRMNCLYKVACKAAARLLATGTPDEIRRRLGILADHSQSELERLLQENAWAEEYRG